MKRKEDVIGLFVKLNLSDMQMINEVSEALSISKSDFVRISVWHYAASDKDGLLSQALKELARQKLIGYKIDVLKELETINNRRVFYLDGFRTALDNFSNKHVPVNYVKSFVRIKLVAIFSLFKSSERKDYLGYIKLHFRHHYSQHSKWLEAQIKYISNLKSEEKDKLFGRFQNGEGTMPRLHEMEGSDGVRGQQDDAVHQLPSLGSKKYHNQSREKK